MPPIITNLSALRFRRFRRSSLRLDEVIYASQKIKMTENDNINFNSTESELEISFSSLTKRHVNFVFRCNIHFDFF
jgi:hypothetical protein